MLSRDCFDGSISFFRPHQYLAREGDDQSHVFLIQEGWACRYRLLPDGRRQITALFLPGDWCELAWTHGEPPAQPVVALTNTRAMAVSCAQIRRECEVRPDLRAGLWSEIVTSIHRQTEWIINLGRKSAIERLSHLFCELFQRLRNSGLTYGDQFAMPLTQIEIADVTGLTPVHVNRTLREMRARGLVELQSKWLRIGDLDELRRIALFQASPSLTADNALPKVMLARA